MIEFNCLTEIEEIGLRSPYNLSDGHAAQDLSSSQKEIINNLKDLWYKADVRGVAVSQVEYLDAFYTLAEDPMLRSSENFCICSSASQSIDMFAAFCFRKKFRVALIEPTFDNLGQIFRRWGIEPVALAEDIIFCDMTEERLMDLEETFDVLFLVSPNNPSGQNLTSNQIDGIVNYCSRTRKILAVDRCFRLFYPSSNYLTSASINSGISYVFIEDTGKVWPTQEVKASILIGSSDLFNEIKEIYREINLSVSGFGLDLLKQFIENARILTIQRAIWDPVFSRRSILKTCIKNSVFNIPNYCQDSQLPVEWLNFSGSKKDADNFYKKLLESGLVILPGKYFYWKNMLAPDIYFRIALMKKESVFIQALNVLRCSISSHNNGI